MVEYGVLEYAGSSGSKSKYAPSESSVIFSSDKPNFRHPSMLILSPENVPFSWKNLTCSTSASRVSSRTFLTSGSTPTKSSIAQNVPTNSATFSSTDITRVGRRLLAFHMNGHNSVRRGSSLLGLTTTPPSLLHSFCPRSKNSLSDSRSRFLSTSVGSIVRNNPSSSSIISALAKPPLLTYTNQARNCRANQCRIALFLPSTFCPPERLQRTHIHRTSVQCPPFRRLGPDRP
mmetsp:Transcript_61523/g.127116  ORF Transcript_61523/g.127116 Transcript_61523/m.127116 type:complete len:232 (-) Transcript_61523:1269-1964(-)